VKCLVASLNREEGAPKMFEQQPLQEYLHLQSQGVHFLIDCQSFEWFE
jgi:hypothetical protein